MSVGGKITRHIKPGPEQALSEGELSFRAGMLDASAETALLVMSCVWLFYIATHLMQQPREPQNNKTHTCPGSKGLVLSIGDDPLAVRGPPQRQCLPRPPFSPPVA